MVFWFGENSVGGIFIRLIIWVELLLSEGILQFLYAEVGCRAQCRRVGGRTVILILLFLVLLPFLLSLLVASFFGFEGLGLGLALLGSVRIPHLSIHYWFDS